MNTLSDISRSFDNGSLFEHEAKSKFIRLYNMIKVEVNQCPVIESLLRLLPYQFKIVKYLSSKENGSEVQPTLRVVIPVSRLLSAADRIRIENIMREKILTLPVSEVSAVQNFESAYETMLDPEAVTMH